MGIVIEDGEILEIELIDGLNLATDFQPGEGTRLPRELQSGLFKMVGVKVQIAEGVDEFAGFQAGDLSHDAGKERIRGDVEGNAKKDIGAALVELAAEGALTADKKLKKGMTGGKGHLVQLSDVPCGNKMAAALGVLPDGAYDLVDLVDAGSVSLPPLGPLGTVNAAEIAGCIRPLIPDRDPVVVQVANIGVAFEEPEEFVDNGLGVNFFRGEEGEGLAEVETDLTPEDGIGADTGPVLPKLARLKDFPQQIKIGGFHGRGLSAGLREIKQRPVCLASRAKFPRFKGMVGRGHRIFFRGLPGIFLGMILAGTLATAQPKPVDLEKRATRQAEKRFEAETVTFEKDPRFVDRTVELRHWKDRGVEWKVRRSRIEVEEARPKRVRTFPVEEKSVRSPEPAGPEWRGTPDMKDLEKTRKPELAPLVRNARVIDGYLGKTDYHAMVNQLSMGDINRYQFQKKHSREPGLRETRAGGGIEPKVER